VTTGKIRMEWDLSINEEKLDYSDFELFKCNENDTIYSREWYPKILLKSKTPIKSYDENTFFDPDMVKSHLKSQISFIKRTEKNFYEFRLIEIINEREVKEHLSFIHPFYEDRKRQAIYISNTTEFMFEVLPNGRYFMY
jgi:hypothetical protein